MQFLFRNNDVSYNSILTTFILSTNIHYSLKIRVYLTVNIKEVLSNAGTSVLLISMKYFTLTISQTMGKEKEYSISKTPLPFLSLISVIPSMYENPEIAAGSEEAFDHQVFNFSRIAHSLVRTFM